MTTARINLSHGTIDSNLELLTKFKMAKRLRPHLSCGLMVECRGREVRLSNFKESNTCRLKSGSHVTMISGEYPMLSDSENLRISNEIVSRYLKTNDVVYFDDGKVVGIVRGITDTGVDLEIKQGGTLKGNASCRFVGGKHS